MPPPDRVLAFVLAALASAGLPRAAGARSRGSTSPDPAPVEWAVELDAPAMVEGVRFPAGSTLHFAAVRGVESAGPVRPRLVRAVPSQSLSLWGLSAAAGEELYLGPFVSLTLERDVTLDGLPLEAGSVVEFERRADASAADVRGVKVVRGATLARAATVQGVALPGGAALEFLPDGALWRLRLLDDDELAGMPVSADEEVSFHPGGRLASWQPSADVVVDGHGCSAGAEVRLFATGRLEHCTPAEETMVGGVVVSAGEPTAFFESGTLAEATLGATLLRDDHVLVEGTRVSFHPNGRLRRVRSPELPAAESPEVALSPQQVRGIRLVPVSGRSDDGAWFRADGTLERVVTGADFEFDGFPVSGALGPVEFWASGRLKSARLSREAVVHGRLRQRGDRVRLERDAGRSTSPRTDSLHPAANR
ncbi:MAG: hypothetical protein RL199_1583 [Pseudomonadota bacterium]|jgi:hypothetical protein